MEIKKKEIWVGFFFLLAICTIIFLCLRVINLRFFNNESTWKLYAIFDNIGNLKYGSPIKIGGVIIGYVTNISIDLKNYSPRVTMNISNRYNHIPDSSSIAVRTTGLLGEQFLELNVGFDDIVLGTSILKDGSTIQDTKSAIVLEDLIGQLLYNSNSNNNKKHSLKIDDNQSCIHSKLEKVNGNKRLSDV